MGGTAGPVADAVADACEANTGEASTTRAFAVYLPW
jgi:hypothetical protein